MENKYFQRRKSTISQFLHSEKNCTFHAVSPRVVSLFSKFWYLREAMTLLFKTHLFLVQSFRRKTLQSPRGTPRPPQRVMYPFFLLEEPRFSDFELKIAHFDIPFDKTFLISFLLLKNSKKNRGRVDMGVTGLSKAWDLPANTVTMGSLPVLTIW